jgi:hypothetical protein
VNSCEIREPIVVRVLPDEVTVASYPGLDRSINIAQLQSGWFAIRRYRNRRIGEFLKELSLTEGRGTGIPKMLKAMQQNGSPLPVFETDEDRTFFLVRLPLWVAETSSGNEVVDSAGFVPMLISHVDDCLSAPALPVFLAPPQRGTRPGEFGPPASDRGAQPPGAQAQTAGQRPLVLGGLERMVAKLAQRVDHLLTRDCHRLATSWVQDVLAMEVPASRRTTAKG